MTTYIIQQYTGRQYEPIPEGNFVSFDAALAGLQELENNLGWRDLRIIASYSRTDLSGMLMIGNDAHEILYVGQSGETS